MWRPLPNYHSLITFTPVDEEFVIVSHDEVPSPGDAERTVNPPPDTDTTEAEHDGPNSDVRFCMYYRIVM
jgi:hypothetical protein